MKYKAIMKNTGFASKNNRKIGFIKTKSFLNHFCKVKAGILFLTVLLPGLLTAQITVSTTPASCGASDGKASVTVNGGTPPYQITWSNGQSGANATNLAVGSYSVTVKDAGNCTGTKSFFIDNNTSMEVSIAGGNTSVTYCQNQGSPSITLTASATGGKPPYQFSWPNASLTTNSSGSYTVMVTDSEKCVRHATTYVLFIPVNCSQDPNEIVGPEGYGQSKWIGTTEKLPYIIRFENDPDFATAPAQKVTVDLPFDSTANMYSLKLGDFGFGNYIFNVPPNSTFYTKRLDVTDSLHVLVDITAGIDVQNKKAFWIFESIDPATGFSPNDANKGFLLINDSITHKGEGFVSFTMQPKSNTHSGDTLKARANIIFDQNEAILTNTWINIIDAQPPFSQVNPLPMVTDTNLIQLTFSGADAPNGSGLKNVALFIAKNVGDYQLYGTFHKDSTVRITGMEDDLYKFISIAEDNVGNKETMKGTPDTYSMIGYPKHISGTISYFNTVSTPINNAKIYLRMLDGIPTDSLYSNSSGVYNFGLKPKMKYLIDGNISIAWGGVNSTDALVIRKNILGLYNLTSLQKIAADVNKSGDISSTDALLIRKRMVGQINNFIISDWVFPKDTLNPVQDIVHVLKTLCAGDVNRSFTPGSNKNSTVTLTQQNEITVNRNQVIDIPLRVNQSLGTAAVSLYLYYPDDILEIEKITSPLNGLMYQCEAGKIVMAWDSLKAMKFKANEAIATLQVRVNRMATDKDKASFTLDNFSEFANEDANTISDVKLSISSLKITPWLDYELSPNFPNPFVKSTEIRYELPEECLVKLIVYNALGQIIRTLVSNTQKAGSYSLYFDATSLEPGAYTYRLEAKSKNRKFGSSHTMIIIPEN